MNRQQQQAQTYFRSAASGWQRKAVGREAEYNLIDGRNQVVLSVLDTLPEARRLLDVGCGTGQLVVDAARRGIDATGVDFAKEMVDQCETNRRAAGVKATFIKASFFDLPIKTEHYDIVSAQGFIEYIAPDEMEEVFARSARMLRPNGALVVGSRNRLFNALSLNAFTSMELALGMLEALIRQSMVLHMSETQDAALAALREFERIDPQPKQHPGTGIGVDIRYQYTPAELICRLRTHGLAPHALYPVHFHGLPIKVKADHPGVHAELATLIGTIANKDQRIIPLCSTFVLVARKDT